MKTVPRRRAGNKYAPLCTLPIYAALAVSTSAQAQNNSVPLLQQPPPQTQAVGTAITEIVVIGNKVLNAEYIRSASGHKVGDPCNEVVLDQMRQNLLETGNFTYFSGAQGVQVRSEEVAGKPGCKVIIQVEENPKIDWKSKVNISGSGPIPPEEIKSLIRQTAVYNDVDFAVDIRAIEGKYSALGYRVGLSPDPVIDPEKPDTLNIKFIVTRVNKITIARNKRTRNVTILRELRTKEGDFYNSNVWTKDLQRVFNLQLFEDVNPAETDAGIGLVDLTINVVERSAGQFLFGAGFSNRQQLVGFAQIENNNFRGLGETVRLRWETGGITGRSTLDLGYTQPWLDKKRTSLSVNVFDRVSVRFANSLNNQVGTPVTNSTDTRYYEQRLGGTITLARPFRQTYTAAATLRAESVRTNPLALTSTNAEILQDGPIFSFGGTLIHDTRDNFLDPVAGSYQAGSLSIGYANTKPVSGVPLTSVNQSVFGAHPFAKAEFEYRLFISPTGPRRPNKFDESKSAFAIKGRAALSVGRLPFFEQYFLGGADSLRGYREDRFWGSNLLAGSIEFRQPFAKSLTGVLFIDAGTTWGGPYQNTQLQDFIQTGFSLHASTGVGMRVRTPLGPLRLDIGIGSEGIRTHFGIANVF